MNKPMKKLNEKSIYDLSDNIAVQNASIAIGGGVVITWNVVLGILGFLGLVAIVGTIDKLGCRCSCRCSSNWNAMAAAQGYGNNAITLARR